MQRAAAAAPPTGQHLYAYCHVKTNQVLYSMSRNLNNSHLKQLPDIGANYTPPKLRKDLWRPLFAVSLPATEEGRIQKIDAMRRLREYRTLHELYWEPSDEMSRPTTKKKIDEMEKKLADRGGSKEETVYDLIAREKWKMRVKMVMDQKANSVADLAATLLKQDEEGARLREEYQQRAAETRQKDVEEMISLASDRVSADLMERLLYRQHSLRQQIEKTPQGAMKLGLQKSMKKLNLLIRRKAFARKQVVAAREARANAAVETLALEAEEARAARESEVRATGAEEKEVLAAGEEAAQAIRAAAPPPPETWSEDDLAYLREALPIFPDALKYVKPSKTAPRYKPVFSTDNITIRWANTLDAEFAEEWPTNVKLEPLGITRYSHPKLPATDEEPEFEPIVEVAEFKALNWKMRKENFGLSDTLADKVMARRAEMGLEEDPDRPNKLRVAEEVSEASEADAKMAAAIQILELEQARVGEEGAEQEYDAAIEQHDVLHKASLSPEERREVIARMHQRALERTRKTVEVARENRAAKSRAWKERRAEAARKKRDLDPSTLESPSSGRFVGRV